MKMKNALQVKGANICKSLLAMLAVVGLAGEANAMLETFNSYSAGSLQAQSSWTAVQNWYGNPLNPTTTGIGNGIGGSNSGAEVSGGAKGSVIAVASGDTGPGGDVIVTALINEAPNATLTRLVLGNAGLVNTNIPLNGNRIFFNTGGDATYSVNTSGDTANPKITGVDFTPFGWVEVRLYVDADGGPQTSVNGGTLVGLVTVSWRDVDNSTGAALTPWTVLGSIPQSYGTPSYVGFVTSESATIDNFSIIPEPTSFMLLVLGCAVLSKCRRR